MLEMVKKKKQNITRKREYKNQLMKTKKREIKNGERLI